MGHNALVTDHAAIEAEINGQPRSLEDKNAEGWKLSRGSQRRRVVALAVRSMPLPARRPAVAAAQQCPRDYRESGGYCAPTS